MWYLDCKSKKAMARHNQHKPLRKYFPVLFLRVEPPMTVPASALGTYWAAHPSILEDAQE